MKEMRKFISNGILHVVTILPVIVWAMIAIIFAILTALFWQENNAVLRGTYIVLTTLFFLAAIIRTRVVSVSDFNGLDRWRGILIWQSESGFSTSKSLWRTKGKYNLRTINLPKWPKDERGPLIVPFSFPEDAAVKGSIVMGKLAMSLKRREFDALELWNMANYSGDVVASLGKLFVKSALEDGRVQLVLEHDHKDLETFTTTLHTALMMVEPYKTSSTMNVHIELTVRRDRVGHTIYY